MTAPTQKRPALLELAEMVAALEVDALPSTIVDRYRGSILDLLAAWILGLDTPTARAFAAVDGGGDGLLMDTAVTAAAAHALELDDVHIDVTGWHPSVAVVSPLLAAGRHAPLHGRDLLAGVVAGWEIGGRIGAAVTPAHRRRGFHATGTIGPIAAAASVARAKGLSAEGIASATALAASMAGGTFGILAGAPETKHLHAAHGAMAGAYAVALVEGGLRGAHGTLEAAEGFFAAYAGGEVDHARLRRPLGRPWEIERQMVKPHACCGHAFGAIDATVQLRARAPFDPADVPVIEVHTYDAAAVLTEQHPADPVAARLSIPWCVAQTALGATHDGLLGTDAFTPAALRRPDFHAVAGKVRVLPSEKSDAVFPTQRRTQVSVPGVGDAEVAYPRGMPENPVDPAALRAKFRNLLAGQLGGAAAELEALVDQIAETPDWVSEVDRIVARRV